ncbi:MAG: hypothetical protein ABIQ11_00700 [Saprospiraceae bacterium]
MKTLKVTRNKSFEWSLGIHMSLLLLGFLPFAHKMATVEPKEYILEIGYQEFPEIQESGSEGLQARSPIYNEQPEPTTNSPEKDPIPVEETEPVKEITVAEQVSEIESEVVSESEIDVVASESSDHGSDAETHGDGGGSGSPLEGDQDCGAMAGDGTNGDGLEGDGIITRKIIYHEDIGRIAKVNGRIVLDICINRQGKVEYVAYDADKTTIMDKEIIRKATDIAARYRYEANYSAPKRECGQLTFIFTIDKPIKMFW